MQKQLLIVFSMLCLHASAQQDEAPVAKTRNNMISASPMLLSQTSAKGFGLQYERFIGNNGKWSIELPVSYSYGQSSPCEPEIKTRMLRAYPGVKFYPAGNKHIVSYAIGATAVLGAGESNCDCNDMTSANTNNTATGTAVEGSTAVKMRKPFTSRKEAGLLINNSVNIIACKNIFIGSDLGVGGNFVNYDGGTAPDIAFRFTFNIGYRF